jgi:glutamate racemase
LSILKALRLELPHEDFVYVADSGYAPYGERDESFVVARSRSITHYLLTHEHLTIKALVIACNTATAAAVHLLRQDHGQLPIIGVEPALKPAIALSQTKRIGVMATRGTLNSHKFKTLLSTLDGQAEFICQPCDGLADAIERDDAIKTEALCAQYTGAIGQFGLQAGQVDTLVLGCTHYPFASQYLRRLVGPAVQLVDNGEPVARQTRRVLGAQENAGHTGQLSLLCTGNCDNLTQAAKRWLGLHTSAKTLAL